MASKLPTIKQIAQQLNLSVSTVSRALHDHPGIGLTTRLKVQKLAKDLKYEPNQTAIFLQKGRTNTIGVILPELSEHFFSAVVSAIEETAYQKNYTVLIAQSHDDADKELALVEKMKNHRVDGLLVSLAKTTRSFDHFENLRRFNIPIVFFDRIPSVPGFHTVSCNIETGTTEAVSYLLKKGHRTIGMINGPENMLASKDRKNGYIQAMSTNRLKFDPSMIVNCDLSEAGTEKALQELLLHKRKVTAIVTFNDYIALFVVTALKKLKQDGRNVELISYGNLPLISYLDHRPVASVEQFPFVQGQKATGILLDLLYSRNNQSNENEAVYNVVIESQLVEDPSLKKAIKV